MLRISEHARAREVFPRQKDERTRGAWIFFRGQGETLTRLIFSRLQRWLSLARVETAAIFHSIERGNSLPFPLSSIKYVANAGQVNSQL